LKKFKPFTTLNKQTDLDFHHQRFKEEMWGAVEKGNRGQLREFKYIPAKLEEGQDNPPLARACIAGELVRAEKLEGGKWMDQDGVQYRVVDINFLQRIRGPK